MNYILPRKLGAKLRADYIGLLVQFLPNSYVMLMRPNKAETAVHGCHCLGDMAVRMHKVLARPWVGVWVCHLLLLSLVQQARFWNSAKLNDNIMLQYPKKELCTRIANHNNYNFWTTKYFIITLFYSFPSKEQNCVLSTMKKTNISYALHPVPRCPFLPLCTWHVSFDHWALLYEYSLNVPVVVEWQSQKIFLATLT